MPFPFDPGYDPNMPGAAAAHLSRPYSIFGGQPPPSMPTLDFSGVPGLGGTIWGQGLGMAMQPLMLYAQQQSGLAALQFMGNQNLMDTFRARVAWEQSRRAYSQVAEADFATYQNLFRGIGRLSGAQVDNADVQAAIDRMARLMQGMAPVLADVMPDAFDRMHGIRGSAQVLARGIYLGGRYGLDPSSGYLGYSGDTAAHVARKVYEDLYGPNADLSAMRGIRAGELGSLYDEMQRRGLFGSARSREEVLASPEVANRRVALLTQAQLGGAAGADAARKLVDFDETAVRDFEADRITRAFKKMTGAVSAVKSIFGDMGQPNAPLPALINALQALTQGGMATMNEDQLEMMVRRTRSLARGAGVNIAGVVQMQARAAAIADEMGIDRKFGVLATQGMLAFAQAYSTTGQGDVRGFGVLDKDRLAALDQGLRMAATRSPVVNQMAATLGVYEQLGGAERFGEKSELGALARAIQKGQTEYTFNNKRRSVALTASDWLDLVGRETGDTAFAQGMLYESGRAFEEYKFRYNLGGLGRRLQLGTDVKPFIATQAEAAMAGRLDSAKFAEAVIGADRADLVDPTKRAQAILKRMGAPVNDANVRAVTAAWAAVEGEINRPGSMFSQYGGFLGLLQAQDPRVLAAQEKVWKRAEAQGEMEKTLDALGRGGPLANFFEYLQTASKKDANLGGFLDFMAKTLGGGVTRQQLTDALKRGAGQKAEDLTGNIDKFKAAIDRMRKAMESGSPAEVDAARKEVEALQGELLPAFEALDPTKEAGKKIGAVLGKRRRDRMRGFGIGFDDTEGTKFGVAGIRLDWHDTGAAVDTVRRWLQGEGGGAGGDKKPVQVTLGNQTIKVEVVAGTLKIERDQGKFDRKGPRSAEGDNPVQV